MNRAPSLVLLDNTVLTNFALVASTQWVLNLWEHSKVATTEAVWREYEAGVVTRHLDADAWTELPIIGLTDSENEFADNLSGKLGAGERSCIAVAVFRGALFVSDDLDARKVAASFQAAITGTIGLLVRAVRLDLLEREPANKLLTQMISAGYRSPVSDLDALLDK